MSSKDVWYNEYVREKGKDPDLTTRMHKAPDDPRRKQ